MHAYEMELQNCPYSKASLCCGAMDPEFVTWLQTACDALVRAPKPQTITVPQHYVPFMGAIDDVTAQYGIEVNRKNGIALVSTEHMKRPPMLLSEAITRLSSLIEGDRIHPARIVIRTGVMIRAAAKVRDGARLLHAVHSQPEGHVQDGQGIVGVLGAVLASEPVQDSFLAEA